MANSVEKGASFWAKISFVIITAVITGLLIPYVSNKIQSNSSQNDAELKNKKELFDDVSKTLLTYEILLTDVSWFKTPNGKNPGLHVKAFERYQDKSVTLITEWRILTAKVRIFSSNDLANRMEKFFNRIFEEQEVPMSILYRRKTASPEEWLKLHDLNVRMQTEASELLSAIAIDMSLTERK